MFWPRHLVGSPLPVKAKVCASWDKYAGLEREASPADLVFCNLYRATVEVCSFNVASTVESFGDRGNYFHS